jgi:acyl-CoA thioesterase
MKRHDSRKKVRAPYFEYLGIKIIDSGEGYAKLSLPFKKELTNPYGMLHGGAMMTLADSAIALAVNSRYPPPFYTTRLEIKFRASVNKGTVFAEARVFDKKKNFVFGKVTISDGRKKRLAEATGTFILLKDPPAAPRR